MDERSTVSQPQYCCRRAADSPIIKSYCHDRLYNAQRLSCQNTVQPQRLNEICMKGKAWLKFACHVSALCPLTSKFNSADLAPGKTHNNSSSNICVCDKGMANFSHTFVTLFFYNISNEKKVWKYVAYRIKRKSPVLIQGSPHFYILHTEDLHQNRPATRRCQEHK